MRALFVLAVMLVNTIWMGTTVIVAAALRIRNARWIYEGMPRLWCKAILRAAGVRMRLHGEQNVPRNEARVYVVNHVSWFDVFALASYLPRYRFIAKKELFKIPIFGAAARATAGIEIDRTNRKAAFQAYEMAARDVKEGLSVVVYPEGTRGYDYRLRPFKKGPFVLAIAAHVPIVPTIIHGTIEIQPKGSFRIRPGVIDIEFLDPVPTAGLTYADRDQLMQTVWRRMADALERHGVHSAGSVVEEIDADARSG
ncbi:MAG: lysophospholipid acyltransferase family protein [Gemmatimonadaceae bacterium]